MDLKILCVYVSLNKYQPTLKSLLYSMWNELSQNFLNNGPRNINLLNIINAKSQMQVLVCYLVIRFNFYMASN